MQQGSQVEDLVVSQIAGNLAIKQGLRRDSHGPLRYLFCDAGSSVRRPAIFLDRDGVINRQIKNGYVTRWEEFAFAPGIWDALARLAQCGFPMVVVSNQQGVGKRLITPAVLEYITTNFAVQLRQAGVPIAAVYYCPHLAIEHCDCRKPKPGLLIHAAADLNLDLKRSILIGDSPTDMEAAVAVGCRPVLLRPNETVTSEANAAVPAMCRRSFERPRRDQGIVGNENARVIAVETSVRRESALNMPGWGTAGSQTFHARTANMSELHSIAGELLERQS